MYIKCDISENSLGKKQRSLQVGDMIFYDIEKWTISFETAEGDLLLMPTGDYLCTKKLEAGFLRETDEHFELVAWLIASTHHLGIEKLEFKNLRKGFKFILYS